MTMDASEKAMTTVPLPLDDMRGSSPSDPQPSVQIEAPVDASEKEREAIERAVYAALGCTEIKNNYQAASKQIANFVLAALRPSREGWQAVPIDQWRIVVDEPVLIYVVHPNAQYEEDENRRKEMWENWTVGKWIKHNGGGWTYHGMMGKVTHVAPLPSPPSAQTSGECKET